MFLMCLRKGMMESSPLAFNCFSIESSRINAPKQ